MRRKPNFNKKDVQKEIDSLIKDINNNSISKELHQYKGKINLYKFISLNANGIIKLGTLFKSLNENVYVHNNIITEFGGALEFIAKKLKYLPLLWFFTIFNFILNIVLLMYIF